MAQILVNNALVSTALRDAATTFKAAIVVSAAAILSQEKPDLDANAAAAVSHFDAFREKLRALRDGILQGAGNARALAMLSTAGTAEIDFEMFAGQMVSIDKLIEGNKRTLLAIVSESTRDGIELFAEQVGILGRTFQFAAFTAGEQAPEMPFKFDQFFLETIADLGQRDWSEAAGKPAPVAQRQ
jgi:hypothetical protein